jgi:hypothetical protein
MEGRAEFVEFVGQELGSRNGPIFPTRELLADLSENRTGKLLFFRSWLTEASRCLRGDHLHTSDQLLGKKSLSTVDESKKM